MCGEISHAQKGPNDRLSYRNERTRSARPILSHWQNHYTTAQIATSIFTDTVTYSRDVKNNKKNPVFRSEVNAFLRSLSPFANSVPSAFIRFFLQSSSLCASFFTDSLLVFYGKMCFVVQKNFTESDFAHALLTRRIRFAKMIHFFIVTFLHRLSGDVKTFFGYV